MEFKKQFSVDEEIMASGWQRFGNHIVDVVFIYLVIFILLVVLSIVTAFFESYVFIEWMDTMGDLEITLIYLAIMLSYFIFFESFSARSLAKYITGTVVVMEDGSKPDLGTITKRTLCRLIPFDPLSFLSSNARGWHDSISDTYVVSKKGLETKMKIFSELEEIGNSPE